MPNKRQRKKRMKLMDQSKATEVIQHTAKEIPSMLLYLGKYEDPNKDYQALLDKQYQGTIQPIEKFINENASTLHYCESCDTKFFAAGKYLLTSKKHVCHTNISPLYNRRKERTVKNSVNPDEFAKRFSQMIWNDYSWKQIAKELKINPNMVRDYFKSEGLI